jgi:multidrug efflux system membrane fusion protein
MGGGVRPGDAGAPGLPAVERSLKWVIVAQRFPVRVLLDNPPKDGLRIGATVSVLVSHGDGR